MNTIKVTVDRASRDVKFQGKRVHYCSLGLLGTCCETQTIRWAMGEPNNYTLRAPGDWPRREIGIRELACQDET